MKGNADLLDELNAVLTAQLTIISQYFVHSKMCEDWGYQVLAKRKRAESIRQMRHADHLIGRVLLLEGVPNLQRMNSVKVGEEPIEQHRLDLASEVELRVQLNAAIASARTKADNGTRELLEEFLEGTEEAVDWHEAQLAMLDDVGRENYLAQKIQ